MGSRIRPLECSVLRKGIRRAQLAFEQGVVVGLEVVAGRLHAWIMYATPAFGPCEMDKTSLTSGSR